MSLNLEELPDLSEDDEWLFHSPYIETPTLKVLVEHDRISKMEHAPDKILSYAQYRY
jgi:hypothetical protein